MGERADDCLLSPSNAQWQRHLVHRVSSLQLSRPGSNGCAHTPHPVPPQVSFRTDPFLNSVSSACPTQQPARETLQASFRLNWPTSRRSVTATTPARPPSPHPSPSSHPFRQPRPLPLPTEVPHPSDPPSTLYETRQKRRQDHSYIRTNYRIRGLVSPCPNQPTSNVEEN